DNTRRLPHPRTYRVALSPDGNWVASATHNGFGVKVWATEGDPRETTLIPFARITWTEFSPDGRWLVISSNNGFEVLEVGSWRSVKQFATDQAGDGAYLLAFNRAGTVMALIVSPSVI